MNHPLNAKPSELEQILDQLDEGDLDRLTDIAREALRVRTDRRRDVVTGHAERARARGEKNVAIWYEVNGPNAGNEMIVPSEDELQRFSDAVQIPVSTAGVEFVTWRYDRMRANWKPGERIVCTSRQGTYARGPLLFGNVVRVAPVVTVDVADGVDTPEVRVSGTLVVQLDGEEPRSINSDVIRHVRDDDEDLNS